MRSLLVLVLLSAIQPVRVHAQCYETPLLAAQSVLKTTVGAISQQGYRSVDVVVDALTRDVSVRVQSCVLPQSPMYLISLHLRLAGQSNAQQSAAGTALQTENRPASPPLIHAGQNVHLRWQEQGSKVELQARAEQAGRIGDFIAVSIPSFSGEHRRERQVHALVVSAEELVYQP